MRRHLERTIVTAVAVAAAIAVNACAPTHPVPVAHINEPGAAESQPAVEPDMQMVRLGGD